MAVLRCHILNVGAGDCIIVQHPQFGNRVTMVDINNSPVIPDEELLEMFDAAYDTKFAESGTTLAQLDASLQETYQMTVREALAREGYDIELTDPVDYYKKFIGAGSIFRFIATHPHMDHLYGLARLKHEIDAGNLGSLINFWDTKHELDKDFSDPQSKGQAEDWAAYQDLRNGVWNAIRLTCHRGDSQAYYDRGNDHISIWAPTVELDAMAEEKEQPNTLSYVLDVHYGSQSIVLAGDAEKDTWDSIYNWFADFQVEEYKVAMLKASHHGHNSGFHEDMMGILKPDYVVVSEGKKTDSDASSKYKSRGADVLSTRWWGNILVELDGVGNTAVYTEQRRPRRSTPASNISHYEYGASYWLLPELPAS